MRYGYSFASEGGWEVLNVANKRSFRLSYNFIDEYVLKEQSLEGDSDREFFSDERATLAADGGLICVAYFYKGKYNVLLVCNPVLRTVKEIPTYRFICFEPTVVMSTNRVSMEYEIYVINHEDDKDHPNALHIYESKTGEWRTASAAPHRLCCEFDERFWCPVSCFLKNKLYKVILIPSTDSSDRAIVSFDKATGVVSDLDLELSFDGDELQLVVSEDRLFCVDIREEPPSIVICDLILARKECIRFTEMPGDILGWVTCHTCLWSDTIASTGCANSILIHFCGGRSAACNLSNKSWHCFYEGRDLGGESSHYSGWHDQEFYASSYCLSLCAP